MGKGHGFLGVAAVLMAASPAWAQQAPGERGYWPLEETASPSADLSGNGINGTWNGGVSRDTANRPVPPNTNPDTASLNFNGTDGWIDLGNPSQLPTGAAARSVAAWGRTSSIAAGWGWIFAYGTPAGSQAFFIGRNAATLYGGGYGDDITVPNFWVAGAWRHITLTYDGTTARLYADGLEVVSGAKTWNLVPSTARIGRQVNNAAEFWNGQIDDVRVFNRVITQTEAAILAGGMPRPTGLMATAGVNLVNLTWTAPVNAPNQSQAYAYQYRIKRSTTMGSGHQLIATVNTTTYQDTGLQGGIPVHYVVSAVSAGESGAGTEASAIPTNPPPRFDDHEEGLLDDKCNCGAASSTSIVGVILGALALGLFALRRS